MQLKLADLAEQIGARLSDGGDLIIHGVNTLTSATAGEISFLANDGYRRHLQASNASAVIVAEAQAELVPGIALVADNPYLAFAKATQLFDNRPKPQLGIHRTAVIADSAQLGENVSIGANVVIGEHVAIGNDCEIGPGTVIGDDSTLGEQCRVAANVTLYHGVHVGDRTVIHSGAVLGADGFGFAPEQQRWHKIAQLGGVRIGSDVEIGANTCIDRGALDDTVIADGVILDNLIQIAHNVTVGEGTAMAACSGIAGSTEVGAGCTVAGGAGLSGHLTIADGVHVAAMALISKSIDEPGVYASGTAQMPLKEWRRSATRFRQLDSMAKRLQQLEKRQEGEV
ncbi:UDP-3-O-(3-hydroxymyristoyl)glucosamine N-acyltransferase [Bacterioplanes sanyensis]|uniref:UDP-3-O-acylglucosamine N-acyltransferase n=1 Tax=Bacterioplanes sanyensis TaxID=1249553 RepID=A0A222FKS6_9GAMM|nr:UDP-3-O-(3-hydroxymyristoyl)glucosamine N-acyltransferase [Bacterioplanes sanyensis]ASP39262.1 UDP-3-O-(3-hydroxymyristoyl)glucosamine N-acyltransferase [Bacterioplanes sanyensis]